jgi:hypothetical protein
MKGEGIQKVQACQNEFLIAGILGHLVCAVLSFGGTIVLQACPFNNIQEAMARL